MKCFVLLAAVLAVCVFQQAAALTLDEQWTQYKKDHNRQYVGEEEAKRKEVFQATVKQVNEHNVKYEAGEVSYSLGINQFADRFPEELKRNHGVRRPVRQTLGADKCTWGPGAWCKTLEDAEKCNGVDFCLKNDWKGVKPSPSRKVRQVLGGGSKCTYGPGYWCKSLENAEECQGVDFCLKNDWKGVKPSPSRKVRQTKPGPAPDSNKCPLGICYG